MGNRLREYLAKNKYYTGRSTKNTSSSSGTNAAYIRPADLDRALKELLKVGKRFGDPDWKRKTLADSAQLVALASQKKQEKSDAVHYYYGGERTNKTRIKIKPGHLRKSIQYLKKLDKTPSAVIGPNIKKNLGSIKNLGRTSANTSGFYAWMSSKSIRSAEDFRRHIMEPALQQTTPAIIAHLSNKVAQRTATTGKQLTFWG